MSSWPLTLQEAKEKHLKELAETIPPLHKEVLLSISRNDYVTRIADVARDIQMPLDQFKIIMKKLKEHGLVSFSHLTREDENLVCGSGYYRSRDGTAVLKLLNIRPYNDDY